MMMAHVDQNHHVTRVTLDRLTKVTAMTTTFSALPGPTALLYVMTVTYSMHVASSQILHDAAPEVD